MHALVSAGAHPPGIVTALHNNAAGPNESRRARLALLPVSVAGHQHLLLLVCSSKPLPCDL